MGVCGVMWCVGVCECVCVCVHMCSHLADLLVQKFAVDAPPMQQLVSPPVCPKKAKREKVKKT